MTDFHITEEARTRLLELTAREKAGSLTPDETSELELYRQLEHLMRVVKARASLLPGSVKAPR
jgi:uncharacterized protein YnzC (UPF0291/DUF896 family)